MRSRKDHFNISGMRTRGSEDGFIQGSAGDLSGPDAPDSNFLLLMETGDRLLQETNFLIILDGQ